MTQPNWASLPKAAIYAIGLHEAKLWFTCKEFYHTGDYKGAVKYILNTYGQRHGVMHIMMKWSFQSKLKYLTGILTMYDRAPQHVFNEAYLMCHRYDKIYLARKIEEMCGKNISACVKVQTRELPDAGQHRKRRLLDAVKKGDFPGAKQCTQNPIDICDAALLAARASRIDILRYFIEELGCIIDTKYFVGGSMKTRKFLIDLDTSLLKETPVLSAITKDILQNNTDYSDVISLTYIFEMSINLKRLGIYGIWLCDALFDMGHHLYDEDHLKDEMCKISGRYHESNRVVKHFMKCVELRER